MTLNELKALYPATAGGVTGHIPMSFVNAHLSEIAAIVKEHNLRRRYRGPRCKRSYSKWSSYAEHTLKADANAMVLYSNSARPML